MIQNDSVAAPVLDRIQSSFLELARHVLPLLGALVIVFVGYLLAALIERVTMRVLRRVKLNTLLERGGVMEAVERTGSHMDPTRVAANLAFWFVMFAVLLVAADALGESLSGVFTELVGYIPSIIGAIVIVMIGNVLGAFVGGLISASVGRSAGGPTLARVARASVIMLGVFMALQELGVATQIVTTAFAILFGAVALALALAFGLGNRELAGEITRAWYERYRQERAERDEQIDDPGSPSGK
jgi:Conserved TM helix